MIANIVVITFGVLLVFAGQRGQTPVETRVVWLGYACHVAASFAQYAITAYWYGGGDIFYYLTRGDQVATLLAHDPTHYWPEVVSLFFHGDASFPVVIYGVGSSTGTMVAIASLLEFLTGGSWLASCLVLSTAAYLSRVGLLRVFLQELSPELHAPVRFGVLLLPSITFWGATLAKETIVLIALGPLAAIARRLADPTSLLNRAYLIPTALVAGGLLWLVKPYVLVAFVVAAGVWWFTRMLRRTGRRLTRTQLVLAMGIAVIGVFGVGEALPAYSLDAIAERAAELQALSSQTHGGSDYTVGSAEARSGLAQAGFVPLALVYSLFRPFFFEVRNPLMAVSALETSFFLYLVVQNLRRGKLAGLVATARESPLIAFSLAFVLLLGVGVGLATTNFGTLARYRMPMLPFYIAFLLVWRHRCAPPTTTPAAAPPARVRLRVRRTRTTLEPDIQ